jgi:hypothetical protein
MFATVKCGAFFAVRTEFLNVFCSSFGFKRLEQMARLFNTGLERSKGTECLAE